MNPILCKWSDYESEYNTELRTCAPDFPEVKYWYRHNVPYEYAPRRAQFCKSSVESMESSNAMWELDCYEPVEEVERSWQLRIRI